LDRHLEMLGEPRLRDLHRDEKLLEKDLARV
jgi:hypothetical protein